MATGDWSDVDIRNAEHLNGAINESLRLHPPVPSGVERKVPKDGVQVGEVFIPGETNFWMPQYVIGRGESSLGYSLRALLIVFEDEDNYENALEFIPERWYSKTGEYLHEQDHHH